MNADKRQVVPGGTVWSEKFAYSRAIRVGNIVEVAGTVSVDEKGQVVGAGDLYIQTKYALEKAGAALGKVGAQLSDVVRTRVFIVAGTGKFEEAGRAHGEVFAGVQPVTSIMFISGLVSPDFLVEVEVSAIVTEDKRR